MCQLLTADHILTMGPGNPVIEDGAILVEAGRVAAIGPREAIMPLARDAPHRALLVDMWRFMDGSARAAETIGNRLIMVPYVGAHPDYSYFDTLDDNEALLERWHRKRDGRIHAWVGLEHIHYTDTAGQRRAVDLAGRFGTGLSTQIAEAQQEIALFAAQYGCRPVQALERRGLLSPDRVLLAHCVWLDDADIEVLARNNVAVAHNPVSNMKLASGAARTVDLLAAGIAVRLGRTEKRKTTTSTCSRS